MSYMRWGYPLKYFKNGVSAYYIFLSAGHEKDEKDFMEDYDEDYKDDKSLVELIGTFIERETGDPKYAWKMVQVLSKKLGIEKDLRGKPLDSDEWFDMVFKKKKSTKKSM